MNKYIIPTTAILVLLTVSSFYLNSSSKIDEFAQWKQDFGSLYKFSSS